MKQLSYLLTQDTELLTLIIILSFFFCGCTFLFKKYLKEELPVEEETEKTSFPTKRKIRYTKKDYYYIILLTGMYAIVSIWRLGSTSFAQTTWQPQENQQSFIIELTDTTRFDGIYAIYGEGNNNASDDYQLGFHNILLEGSNDLTNWETIDSLTDGSIYQYQIKNGSWDYHYVRVTSSNPYDTISELGFYASYLKSFLPVSIYEDHFENSVYPAKLVLDEQHTLVSSPTYYDQGYFDEVYHPRNAWEIAHGQFMYSHVHPLFGTTIMAFFMLLFGTTPFGWRFAGWLFGVLLVPVFYATLKRLFTKTGYCALGTLYLCIEFMHLTTSRIGTLEPFSVFFILTMYYFMICYIQTNFYDTPFTNQKILLFLCGLMMSFGFATKWTVCYSAVGLAILFFVHLYMQIKKMQKIKAIPVDEVQNDMQLQHLQEAALTYEKNIAKLILYCVGVFIILPIVFYFVAYLPTPVWRDGYSIAHVIEQTKGIYNYHSTLTATHPYQSSWYEWLLDIRPVWYYFGSDEYIHTIACFTHPLLTWLGLISILYTITAWISKKDNVAFIIMVGYLTALLPWVSFVKRCIFAYHFYPTSFFMLMSIIYFFEKLSKQDQAFRRFITIFTILCVLVFILYLPVITGFGTSSNYIHALEIFESWYFG